MSVAEIKVREDVQEKFDREFASGKWSYLASSAREVPRYGAVSGYVECACPEGQGILDLGCGEGVLFRYLPERHRQGYVGVDVSDVALNKARKENIKELYCSPMEKFIPPRQFGVIIFNEVLFYTLVPLDVVAHYRPYLTEDGCVILSAFRYKGNESSIWAGLDGRGWDVFDRTKITSARGGLIWDLAILRPR